MSKLTSKDRGLIKGALRRVFSRSQLRREALLKAQIVHTDPYRPRVTKWGRCSECCGTIPLYLMEIDHVDPLVPLHLTLEDMSWDDIVNRLWCDESNLKAMCKPCHKEKSKLEAKQRSVFKKERKLNESQGTKVTSKKRSAGVTTNTTKRRSVK